MPKQPFHTASINRLFLVCPTDNLEQPILNHFKCDAFFYTALGVFFELDCIVQSLLVELIYENRIEEVVFVTAINNIFYEQVFNKNVRSNYPVNDALADVKKKISEQLVQPEIFANNNHLLIAQHLKNERHRLLSTNELGRRLIDDRIVVDAYVYQPDRKLFSSLDDIEKIGHLLNSFSSN